MRSLIITVAAAGLFALGAGTAVAQGGNDATATGSATHSPGLLSGDEVQAPIDLPANVCGDTLDGIVGIGALNPTIGNACMNGG